MSRRLAAVVLLALSLPQLALAEQARIALFDAVARAEPRPDAGPLETFAEGTAVSVSEVAEAGWRRIRLGDGHVGWIEDRALAFGAPVTVRPVAPTPLISPPPGALSPDLRPRVYVKDLDNLSKLVSGDPVMGLKVEELTKRRTAAWTVGGLGLATALGCLAYGSSEFGKHSDPNDPRFGDAGNGPTAMALGGISLLVSAFAAAIIAPKDGDLLDVINGWNERHPDQQFTVEHHLIER